MQDPIQVSELKKSYPLSRKQRRELGVQSRRKIAVEDLSFSVDRGEIFGLLGPNGAGKTTTLRILATLIKPDSGDVRVCGRSVVASPVEVRKRIGFLTSELRLEEVFTPDYLFDLFSDLHDIDSVIRNRRKEELFSRFGIGSFAQTKIADLSTGMKQKASLVISIASDPEVIIFDEPTNGLDLIAARVVTDFLLELKERGKTILLSTHIFELAERVCDRIGIIIDGKMAQCGPLAEMTASESLESVFFGLYDHRDGRQVAQQ